MTFKSHYLSTKVATVYLWPFDVARAFVPWWLVSIRTGLSTTNFCTIGKITHLCGAGSAQGEGILDPQLGGAAECRCRQRALTQAGLLFPCSSQAYSSFHQFSSILSTAYEQVPGQCGCPAAGPGQHPGRGRICADWRCCTRSCRVRIDSLWCFLSIAQTTSCLSL